MLKVNAASLPPATPRSATPRQANVAARLRGAASPLPSARCATPQHRMHCRMPETAPRCQSVDFGPASARVNAPFNRRCMQRVFVHDELPQNEQRMIREICKDPRKEALPVNDDELPVTIETGGKVLLPLVIQKIPGTVRPQVQYDPTLKSALGAYLCAAVAMNGGFSKMGQENPALFVTTSPAFTTLALCHRYILEEEIHGQLSMLGLGWKPMLPIIVVWSDFEVLATPVDSAGKSSAAAKGCHMPLGGPQNHVPTKRASLLGRKNKFSISTPTNFPRLEMGIYSEAPKATPMDPKTRDFGIAPGATSVTLRADGSWAYCAMPGDGGAYLEAQGTPKTGPWEIQNGFLVLPRSRLRVNTVQSIENGLVVGERIPVDPSEQAISISLSVMEEWEFIPQVDEDVNVLENLKKWIGLGLHELACDVTPGTYELQEHDRHITLSLYEGSSFAYQETRELPGGCAEEIASDHRFGRWRVDNRTQMLHLYAPSRHCFKHRRLARGSAVWERPLESVALPIGKLVASSNDSGAQMSFRALPGSTIFPDHEPPRKTPNTDQDMDMDMEQEVLTFEEFRDALIKMGFPDANDEARDLFRFFHANSSLTEAEGVICKEDMYSLDQYGATAEPEWVDNLHKWLVERPGGVEGFFDMAISSSNAKGDGTASSRRGSKDIIGDEASQRGSKDLAVAEDGGDQSPSRQGPSSKEKHCVEPGISKDIFVAALDEADYPHLNWAESIFKSLDLDRDGTITRDNLRVLHLFAAMNMMRDVKRFKDHLQSQFDTVAQAMKVLDKDKSKKISEEEWHQAMNEIGVSTGMSSRIFGFVDMDGSKQITADELEHFLSDLEPQEFVEELEKFRDTCISTYGSLEATFEIMTVQRGEENPKDKKKRKSQKAEPEVKAGELSCDSWPSACARLDFKFPMDTCWIFTFLDVTRSHTVSLEEFMFLSAFNPSLLNGSPKRLQKHFKSLFRDTDETFKFFLEVAKKRRGREKLSSVCKQRMRAADDAYKSGQTARASSPASRKKMDTSTEFSRDAAIKKPDPNSVWSRGHQMSQPSDVYPGIRCRSPLFAKINNWGPTTAMEKRPSLVVPPRPHSVASGRYSVASGRY